MLPFYATLEDPGSHAGWPRVDREGDHPSVAGHRRLGEVAWTVRRPRQAGETSSLVNDDARILIDARCRRVGAGITGLSIGLNLARRRAGGSRSSTARVSAPGRPERPARGGAPPVGNASQLSAEHESFAFFRDLDAQLGIADTPVSRPAATFRGRHRT